MPQLLLVRHGQASWGASDYDVLSAQGVAQSRLLGQRLVAGAAVPTSVVSGSMRRHRDTAALAVEAAGWSVVPTVDEGWDEFDHLAVLARVPSAYAAEPTREQFELWFDEATRRWSDGAHEEEYDEPFAAFLARAQNAVRRIADGVEGTAVVFTSGGPIAAVVASLLDRDHATSLWHRLNPVLANCSVTKLVVGRRGTTLVTFNEHDFLLPDHLTYR